MPTSEQGAGGRALGIRYLRPARNDAQHASLSGRAEHYALPVRPHSGPNRGESRMAPADGRRRQHDPQSSAVRRHVLLWNPSSRSSAQESGETRVRARRHGTQGLSRPDSPIIVRPTSRWNVTSGTNDAWRKTVLVPSRSDLHARGRRVAGRVDLLRPLRSPHVHPLHRSIRQFAPRLSECSNQAVKSAQCQSLCWQNLSMIWWRPKFSRAAGTGFAGIKPCRALANFKKNENAWTATGNSACEQPRYDARRERNGNTESSNPKIDLSPANWSAPLGNNELKALQDVGTSMHASPNASADALDQRAGSNSVALQKPSSLVAYIDDDVYRSAAASCRLLLERAVVNVRGIRVRPCYVAVGRRFSPHSTNSSDLFFVTIKSRDSCRMVESHFRNCADQGWSFVKIAEQLNQEDF